MRYGVELHQRSRLHDLAVQPQSPTASVWRHMRVTGVGWLCGRRANNWVNKDTKMGRRVPTWAHIVLRLLLVRCQLNVDEALVSFAWYAVVLYSIARWRRQDGTCATETLCPVFGYCLIGEACHIVNTVIKAVFIVGWLEAIGRWSGKNNANGHAETYIMYGNYVQLIELMY